MEPVKETEQNLNHIQQNSIYSESEFDTDFFRIKKMSADSAVDESTGNIVTNPVSFQEESTPAISDAEVRRNTETIINFRENVQAFGISYVADGDLNHADLYNYAPWQKKRLVEAWLPIIAKSGLKISPWLDVIMAEVICTGPLVGLAFQNRKYRIELEAAKITIKNMQANEMAAANNNDYKSSRTDGKNVWTVDKDGYFTYTPKNVYIDKADRHQRPELTPENYELLCKHNGKEKIDKIFKIQN